MAMAKGTPRTWPRELSKALTKGTLKVCPFIPNIWRFPECWCFKVDMSMLDLSIDICSLSAVMMRVECVLMMRPVTVTATSHHYPALSQPGDTTPTILQPTIKYQQYVLTLKFFDDRPNDHLCLIIIMLCRWLGVELISNLALLGQTLPTPQGIYTQEGNYLMDSRQVGIFNSCVYIPCYSRFTPRNKIAIVKSKMFSRF